MATPAPPQTLARDGVYHSDSDSDGQARGGRKSGQAVSGVDNPLASRLPTYHGLQQPSGQMLKGAVDENGRPKTPSLLVGIKLDLEAEVHLTARVRGDICVGLY